MTIGNLSSKICQMPSMHSVVIVALLPILIKNCVVPSSSWMSSGKQTERCSIKYSGRYSSQSPLNIIPTPRAGITMFSVQMATLGVANWLYQHGLQIALSIATYIILSGMSAFGASVQRTNLEMMSLWTSNTPSGIMTCIERSVMPTPRQPMPKSCCAMFTKDSKCFDISPVSWATSLSPTSSIQSKLACLTTSRSGFSTSWRRTNGLTSTIQSGYPCLLTTTSHQKISHMKKFLNGMGRRWRKWASTYLEL